MPLHAHSPFGPGRPPERLLVVRLGAVGDIVRTLPAVRLLRRSWPGARITWAAEPGPATLLKGQPDVDEVVIFERKNILMRARHLDPRAVMGVSDFVHRLRDPRPDLALDFQASFKSALVAWLSCAPVRAGFDAGFDREGSHHFANLRVTLPEPRVHRVLRAAALARAAGAEDGPLVADLGLTDAERDAGRALVRRHAGARRAIALAPFSSPRQPYKRYPLARWGAVARGLADAGHAVLVLAGPGAEETAARRFCEEFGPGLFTIAPPLRELAGALAASDLFVGGDTGPMHIAWSVGLKTVVVYGPTDPVLNAPFGEGHRVLAPPYPTQRHDPDPFPGITVELILTSALEALTQLPLPEDRP